MRCQDNVRDLLVMTHDRIQEVLDSARTHYDALAHLCDAIALLDMCHSFADNVSLSTETWCRPLVSEGSTNAHINVRTPATAHNTTTSDLTTVSGPGFQIVGGRYGISSSSAAAESVEDGGPAGMIANDTYVDEGKNFTLITGINGSGKSTYLKQIAIIVILAHCGSHVPAEQAVIPVRDRLCTRIGNADDQEHNISTFMHEMKETAFICRNATDRSLVCLDELGRATSNEDGVAIAWSLSEYLLKKRALCFFVTHYPHLNRLADVYPNVQNVHLEASVGEGEGRGSSSIRYTHKVKSGCCSVSTDYGVELAAACGWTLDTQQDARGMETTARELLPGDAVCHRGEGSEARAQAFKLAVAAEKALQPLIANLDSITSMEGLREALHVTQQGLVAGVGNDVLSKAEHLLYRGLQRFRQPSEDPAPGNGLEMHNASRNDDNNAATKSDSSLSSSTSSSSSSSSSSCSTSSCSTSSSSSSSVSSEDENSSLSSPSRSVRDGTVGRPGSDARTK